jgi:hypothetical protein
MPIEVGRLNGYQLWISEEGIKNEMCKIINNNPSKTKKDHQPKSRVKEIKEKGNKVSKDIPEVYRLSTSWKIKELQ